MTHEARGRIARAALGRCLKTIYKGVYCAFPPVFTAWFTYTTASCLEADICFSPQVCGACCWPDKECDSEGKYVSVDKPALINLTGESALTRWFRG